MQPTPDEMGVVEDKEGGAEGEIEQTDEWRAIEDRVAITELSEGDLEELVRLLNSNTEDEIRRLELPRFDTYQSVSIGNETFFSNRSGHGVIDILKQLQWRELDIRKFLKAAEHVKKNMDFDAVRKEHGRKVGEMMKQRELEADQEEEAVDDILKDVIGAEAQKRNIEAVIEFLEAPEAQGLSGVETAGAFIRRHGYLEMGGKRFFDSEDLNLRGIEFALKRVKKGKADKDLLLEKLRSELEELKQIGQG